MNAGSFSTGYSNADALAAEISTLYAHINAATFTLLEKIRRFDELKLYAKYNCKSTAHWLNWACGIGLGAGREKVRVAHALSELPKIEQAFRSGTVSYSKVRAITRVAGSDNEAKFLNIARHATASQTERIIKNHRRVLACQADKTHSKRHLRWLWDDDGGLVFEGRLSADQGALFIQALEQVFKEQDKRELHEAAHQDNERLSTKRADALVLLVERTLAAKPATASTADRYQVSVHVSAEALKGELDTDDPPQIGHRPISIQTAQRLTCDGSIVPIIENAKGEPLSIGRKTRTVPPALRRALHRRDKGCRFPSCEQTHYVDAHHIRHWAHGGETNLDNLVLLCRYHHRQLHEGGFSIERHCFELQFNDPDGRAIPVNNEDHRAGDTATLVKNVSAETFLEATSLTPETGSQRPDYHHIAWVLAQTVEPGPTTYT
jgi:hypothetical protein